jgi:hypothetical protein
MWVGYLPWWLFFVAILARGGFPSWTFVVRVFEPLTTKDAKVHEGRQAGVEQRSRIGWEHLQKAKQKMLTQCEQLIDYQP